MALCSRAWRYLFRRSDDTYDPATTTSPVAATAQVPCLQRCRKDGATYAPAALAHPGPAMAMLGRGRLGGHLQKQTVPRLAESSGRGGFDKLSLRLS